MIIKIELVLIFERNNYHKNIFTLNLIIHMFDICMYNNIFYMLLLLFNLHLSIYLCFDKSLIRYNTYNSNVYLRVHTLLYKEAHCVLENQ